MIRIRHAYVLQDALQCIVRATQAGGGDFYKELKRELAHEEGVDQGGVRKELFQFVMRECFCTMPRRAEGRGRVTAVARPGHL